MKYMEGLWHVDFVEWPVTLSCISGVLNMISKVNNHREKSYRMMGF
jgi:hypothetical protein